MTKSFAEWKKERRITVTLPSGIEAELRLLDGLKMAAMGPLAKMESVDDKRGIEMARRYVDACLVRLAEEKDPIGSGFIEAYDFSLEDINAIVDAVTSLMPKREVADDAVPLADTDSPGTSPESSTE